MRPKHSFISNSGSTLRSTTPTGRSHERHLVDRLPAARRPGDVASMKAVIDWLNGCEPGYDNDGNPVTAPWHNGNAAMIGKSYDGTPANGLAATGVDGLTTIRRGGRPGGIRRQVMTLAR